MKEKEELRQLVRERFAQINLDPSQLRTLEQATRSVKSSPPKAITVWYSLACLSFLVVLSGFIWFDTTDSKLIARISKEVSTNHLYTKPLDYKSTSFIEVAQFFDRLDFNPVLSDSMPSGYTLKGGRYCTLQGQIALLLRFENSKGSALTYYLTRDSKTFDSIPTQSTAQTTDSGVKVQVWRDEGLMAAMAIGV